MYPILLLDADGTLYDFDRAEREALCQTVEAVGLPFSEALLDSYSAINEALWEQIERGEITRDFLQGERFRQLCAALDLDADAARMSALYVDFLSRRGDLIDGAVAVCAKLSERHDLYIVTNGIARVQRGRMAQSPLGPYIKQVFISEEVSCAKPDPRFFDAVFEALGVTDRSGALVVGDSVSSDIQGGINAGIDTCLYNPKGFPHAAAPTYEIRALEELYGIVD